METLINSMYQKFGRLDCLVNNAGITGPRSPIVGIINFKNKRK